MVGGDVVQHSLQFGSLRRPCGPARVDELGDHVGAEGFGFAALRLALGRDRESLVPPAGGGLLLGGDPLLGHRRYPPLTRGEVLQLQGGHRYLLSSSSRLRVPGFGCGGCRPGAAPARPVGPCRVRPGARVRRSTSVRCRWCVHTLCPTGGHPTPERKAVVVRVPEGFRHRSFCRDRAGRCRVGWFTTGDDFPSRESQPEDARSVLPCSGSRYRGLINGLLSRCAPRSPQDAVAVASTDTPVKG